MKDERYCKKKLAQFRVEFAPKSSAEQPGSSASVDSPAPRDSKGTPSTPKKSCDDDDYLDEDPKESLPSSQQDGGDTPMDGNFGEGPSSAKREREDTGEMSDRDGSTSPKRARSASPQRPSQIAVLTNSSQSLPQSPTITNLQIQPISGKDTPKRAREDDHEEPASAETTARVFKRPRSRSNSPNPPSDGFEVKEVIHHPQALRTGA